MAERRRDRRLDAVRGDPFVRPSIERNAGGAAWPVVAEWAKIATILAVAVMFTVRLMGPSDLWEKTQPKTIGYTTDIVVNGRFVLPMEHGTIPASKPPLYNWLAAPAVAILGTQSEFAHRLPSIVAMIGCIAIVVVVGRRVVPGDPAAGRALGWLAALMLPANLTLFKLSTLARPDMVLTFWMLAGWAAATIVLIDARQGRRATSAALLFWLCVAMGGLTKGPPVLVLLLYALVAARPVGGAWSATRHFGWWWGVPLAVAPTAAWLLAAAQIDANHVIQRLLLDEVWGRVAGTGPLGRPGGPIVLLTGVAHMPLYFLGRSAPWSVFAILGALWLFSKDESGERHWRSLTRSESSARLDGRWLVAAVIMTATVLFFFSLSAGKRADYIAPAYPVAAIIAAAWLLHAPPRLGRRWPWFAPLLALFPLVATSIAEMGRWRNPGRSFIVSRESFLAATHAELRQLPLDLVMHGTGENDMQALLGVSVPDDDASLIAALSRREAIWLISAVDDFSIAELPYFEPDPASERQLESDLESPAEASVEARTRLDLTAIGPWRIEPRARFAPTPHSERTAWPPSLTLYLLLPADPPGS